MRNIRHANRADVEALADVLHDVVAGGASVGFMLPLPREKAVVFWQGALASAARGERIVLVAEDAATNASATSRTDAVLAGGAGNMAEADTWRASVTGSGQVVVRQRPALLLMKLRLYAAEATLELGLAKLREQRVAAEKWLTRLGAERIASGEPYLGDPPNHDPLARARAATVAALGKKPNGADQRERNVGAVLTAVWPLAGLSAEEALVLLDRLRFEATQDDGAVEPAEELPDWASPVDQMKEMMARMHEPPADDKAPQFLFIFRLGDEQRALAQAEAYARACQHAQQIAHSAGLTVGMLTALHLGHGGAPHRVDQHMERQRVGAILADCAYALDESDIVSEDSRSAEFHIHATVHYALNRPSPGHPALGVPG